MKSKTLKNFRIYVAGHNGMVGRAVIRYLKKEGVKNIIFADRKKINLLNSKDLEKFIKLSKPNIIINCAGKVGGILANASYPVEFINENIFIQLNLINLAYKLKIKHFINLGSSHFSGIDLISSKLGLSVVSSLVISKTILFQSPPLTLE